MSDRRLQLCLFVAGDALNSQTAVSNLNAVCDEHFGSRCDIEVIDVFEFPDRALKESVFFTPTLMILSATPPRRIIGNLSNRDVLLHALTSHERTQ